MINTISYLRCCLYFVAFDAIKNMHNHGDMDTVTPSIMLAVPDLIIISLILHLMGLENVLYQSDAEINYFLVISLFAIICIANAIYFEYKSLGLSIIKKFSDFNNREKNRAKVVGFTYYFFAIVGSISFMIFLKNG